jgi:hypothetical protein
VQAILTAPGFSIDGDSAHGDIQPVIEFPFIRGWAFPATREDRTREGQSQDVFEFASKTKPRRDEF